MLKKQYNNEGFLRFDDFFSRDEILEMNKVIDTLQASLEIGNDVFDESGSGKIKQIQYLHQKHQIFSDLIEKLSPIAEQLAGPNLNVLNVQLFEKHPHISKPTRSHQDNAYFKVTPAIALTFWIALDDIDKSNGALYYAPKTHLTPTRKHVRYHPHTTFRIRSGVPGLSLCLKEHPEETDKYMETPAGTLLVHHCNLIHRAGKNNSEQRRRAIGVVFIPEECKKDARLWGYHNAQLEEDIELQKVKNPKLYEQLKAIVN